MMNCKKSKKNKRFFTLLTNYSKSNFSLQCCVTFLLFLLAPSPFLCFWKLYRIFIILHLLFILFSSLIIIIISIAINSKMMKKKKLSIEKNHEREEFWDVVRTSGLDWRYSDLGFWIICRMPWVMSKIRDLAKISFLCSKLQNRDKKIFIKKSQSFLL